MNADKLADELDKVNAYSGDVFFGTCASMMRHLQAENEELRKLLDIALFDKAQHSKDIRG